MSDTPTTSRPAPASRYGAPRQKVPPFARFVGTSAWKKYHRRAREYARFRAAANLARQAADAPSA